MGAMFTALDKYPSGALVSFGVALAIAILSLIIVLVKEKAKLTKSSEKGDGKSSLTSVVWEWIGKDSAIKAGLIIVFFIALWLAVRAIGLNLEILLFDEDHQYKVLEVFDVLAYVLAVRLCLTLLKSDNLDQIVSAALQSVLIGLLVFLPRATNLQAKDDFGTYGSAILLVGFAASLIALSYVYKFVLVEKKK